MSLPVDYDGVCAQCSGPLRPLDKAVAGRTQDNQVSFTAAVSCGDCSRHSTVSGCLQPTDPDQLPPRPAPAPTEPRQRVTP